MTGATNRSGSPQRQSYWITTLGCPKNEVDSLKLAGRLEASGYDEARAPGEADLIVVNTCAFIEPAREESVATILDLSTARRPGARLAVTGCLAERSGEELAESMPEIDVVAGFDVDFAAPEGHSPVSFRRRSEVPSFDLLELPRPPTDAEWAYVKVAEGCDRACGFCAIPTFRGRQRSRELSSILAEVESLDVAEVVLVAQDLASFGRDRSGRDRPGRRGSSTGIVGLVKEVSARVPWVRLLYIYPTSLNDELVDTIAASPVPYFDLSLQHVSTPLLRKMRRPGSRARFIERIARIRKQAPDAVLRSSFILGYPGETERDHDELLGFLEEAELDWAGFFTFSREPGTYADGLEESSYVEQSLALERLGECSELQDAITVRRRGGLVGTKMTVLVEETDPGGQTGLGRSYREAPEIDGVVRLVGLDARTEPGPFVRALCVDTEGPDLVGEVVGR